MSGIWPCGAAVVCPVGAGEGDADAPPGDELGGGAGSWTAAHAGRAAIAVNPTTITGQKTYPIRRGRRTVPVMRGQIV